MKKGRTRERKQDKARKGRKREKKREKEKKKRKDVQGQLLSICIQIAKRKTRYIGTKYIK